VAKALEVHRTYPILTYTDKFALHHGGREFEFFSMTGDAQGTTVMYLPKEKILATGDLLSVPVPYYSPPPGPARAQPEDSRPIRRSHNHPWPWVGGTRQDFPSP